MLNEPRRPNPYRSLILVISVVKKSGKSSGMHRDKPLGNLEKAIGAKRLKVTDKGQSMQKAFSAAFAEKKSSFRASRAAKKSFL